MSLSQSLARSLAALTLVITPVFLFTEGSQVARFAYVTPAAAVVMLLVTAAGLLGSLRGWWLLCVGAGVGAGLSAALQLIQLGRDANLIGGTASTFSVLMALAIGWGGIAAAERK